jgi:hypothetical protein
MRVNPYKDMRASELMAVIDDTIFQKETDKEIAINVFVRAMTIEKAASIVGYDWKTVQKRLPGIEERLNHNLKN